MSSFVSGGQSAAAPPAGSDVGSLAFEEALAELERIVRGLEGGQQRLEDAITAYERGAALRRHCETKLREAEMRVEKIVTNANEVPTGMIALDPQGAA